MTATQVAPTRAPSAAGLLAMDLVEAPDGRTRLRSLTQRFPQRVTAPMYVDPGAPGAAYVCVQNPSGGLFPGDRLRTEITAGSGTHVTLRGQSATQIYGGDPTDPHRPTHHDYAFRLEPGAVVEHAPDVTIPHADSDYRQRAIVRVSGDAVFLGWEALAAGRIGHGERFGFRGVELRTEFEVDGSTRAVDVQRFRPEAHDPRRRGSLGAFAYAATMSVVAPAWPRALEHLEASLRRELAERPGPAAVSPMPDGLGLTIRLLDTRAPDLRRTLRETWSAARGALLGLPHVPDRIPR